jgi:lysophospholipase L1-like esterase
MMPTLARRCLTVVATAGSAAALTLAGSGAAHAASANYVALGDSYSSGVGAGSYTSSSGSCDRSTNAYAQLWDNANSPSSFAFEACSGATTADVLSSQVSALSSSTTLVSITIGGNDVGFSSDMETCILDGTSACVSAIDNSESEAENSLPAKLDDVLSTIKSDAPNAKVVVLDYPEFYDLSQSSSCVGLSGTSRTAIDGGADVLDGVIQTAAEKYNDTFADVRSAFSGHEICDSNSWLHSLNILDIDESYHPTAAGQSGGYYPVFSANA